ncbi:MAG: CPBP family intramembrane glutamic endopeptidase [Caldilineaceae bacterium]
MSTLTLNPKARFSGSIRNVLARYPLVAYFVLAFAGSWLCLAPMVLGQDGLGFLPYSVPFGLYVALFLAASFTGPTLAALVVTAALEGKPGVKQFLRRYGQWRVGFWWYLLMLLGFPVIYFGAASLWMGGEALQALGRQWGTFFTVYLAALLIFPGLLQWGEEPGWRGFAQTRLQGQVGALWASLVVGFLHGVWHLPNHLLIVGPPAAGPFDLTHFAINTAIVMAITLLFTWVFNGGQQSILVAVLTHASFNAAQAWLATLLPNQPVQVGYTALIIIAVCAIAVVLLTKGKLGHAPSQEPRAHLFAQGETKP